MPSLARRTFLHRSAYGLGGMALASLLDRAFLGRAAAAPAGLNGILTEPHFPIRARRVSQLSMAGGPSHLDTFDWKARHK